MTFPRYSLPVLDAVERNSMHSCEDEDVPLGVEYDSDLENESVYRSYDFFAPSKLQLECAEFLNEYVCHVRYFINGASYFFKHR
jgi:hypothetical protein